MRTEICRRRETGDGKIRKRRHVDYTNEMIGVSERERDETLLQPIQFCSRIVDIADKSAFGLPHFDINMKGERGHLLKVRFIGIL